MLIIDARNGLQSQLHWWKEICSKHPATASEIETAFMAFHEIETFQATLNKAIIRFLEIICTLEKNYRHQIYSVMDESANRNVRS